ncbi:hypothetical protein PC120_g17670 [Phytophthora cactorum]|nr:hypothetical protein PC120_g17670 [Phytophthora cactorum]
MLNNGLSECFGGAEGFREKCKRLVSSLLPVSLKKEVKQCVRFTHNEAATDARQLFRLILEKATEYERQYHRLKQQKKYQPDRAKGGSKPAESVKQKRWNDKKFPSPNTFSTPSVSRKPAIGMATPKATTGSKSNSSLPPPGPCPKCSQMHWLRECTHATEAEKSQLAKHLREAKKTKIARLKRLGEILPVSDRQVTLNGVLTVPYCPDSGSDYTVVGRSHWELLHACDPNIEAERLDVPVGTQKFGATPVTAEFKTSLYVMIHIAAGPVEPMQAAEVLIVDVDDDEFIVDNDLLTTLGIDVDRQLNHGDVETSGDTIELDADEMPVDPSGSVSSDSDIFAAVERLMDRALKTVFLSITWSSYEPLLMRMTCDVWSCAPIHLQTCRL